MQGGNHRVSAATAAQRPEEVGVGRSIDGARLAVRCDELDGAHPVARKSVLAASGFVNAAPRRPRHDRDEQDQPPPGQLRAEVPAATPGEELRSLGKLGIHGITDGERFFVLMTNGDGDDPPPLQLCQTR